MESSATNAANISSSKTAEHNDEDKDNNKNTISTNTTTNNNEDDEDEDDDNIKMNLNFIKRNLKKQLNISNNNNNNNNKLNSMSTRQDKSSTSTAKNKKKKKYATLLNKELLKLKEINNLFDSSIETTKEAANLLASNFKADARSIKETISDKFIENENESEDEISEVIIFSIEFYHQDF
jgi:hypothetical protein